METKEPKHEKAHSFTRFFSFHFAALEKRDLSVRLILCRWYYAFGSIQRVAWKKVKTTQMKHNNKNIENEEQLQQQQLLQQQQDAASALYGGEEDNFMLFVLCFSANTPSLYQNILALIHLYTHTHTFARTHRGYRTESIEHNCERNAHGSVWNTDWSCMGHIRNGLCRASTRAHTRLPTHTQSHTERKRHNYSRWKIPFRMRVKPNKVTVL